MTTKTDKLVDMSTLGKIFSLANDTMTTTKALHERISDARRIAFYLALSTSLAILTTQGGNEAGRQSDRRKFA